MPTTKHSEQKHCSTRKAFVAVISKARPQHETCYLLIAISQSKFRAKPNWRAG